MVIKRTDIACARCKKLDPMPPMRSCSKCRAIYANAHYRQNTNIYILRKDRWKADHHERVLEQTREYNARRGNALKNEWRKQNPERSRATNRKSLYKLRYGEYAEAKMILNELKKQLTGNPRSFMR